MIGPASGDLNLCLSWPIATPPSPDGIDWQIGLSDHLSDLCGAWYNFIHQELRS